MRIVAALGSIVVAILVLSGIAVANAGFVYRVDCRRAGGATDREWTYRWNSVIPFIGYERQGCKSHNAPRIVLDAVGLWKLEDNKSAAKPPALTEPADTPGLDSYPPGAFDRAVQRCVQQGASRSFCECQIAEFMTRLTPRQWNVMAYAIQGGARKFDDLPEGVRDKVYDAVAAVKRDC